MGISDEIEVATIATDEATILAIKATIAIPFQSSLTTLQGRAMMPMKPTKKWAVPFRRFRRLALSSLVALEPKKFLISVLHATISPGILQY